MPVIAIGGAIAAVVGVSGTVGGLIAGTAALTVTSALEIVGAVGAVVGAVGVVTGDKTLSMIGLALGGIGGLGSLAVNAGLFGAEAGGTVLFGASNAISDATALPGEMATAGGVTAAPDIVDSLGSFTPVEANPASSLSNAVASTTGSDIPGMINSVPANAAQTAVNAGAPAASSTIASATPAADVQAATQVGSVTGVPAIGAPSVTGVAAPTNAIAQAGTTATAAAPSSGFWSDLLKQPGVGYGLIQSAGSFLAGATDELKPAQVAALNVQTARNKAALANMKEPIPVASRTAATNVTGVPAGMINTPIPAVTGAPA